MTAQPRLLTTAAAYLLAAVLALANGAQVGIAVVCVGADGHIDIESSFDGCCRPVSPPVQNVGGSSVLAVSSCGDCVDLQLKAPPFHTRKDQLSRPDPGCGSPLGESCCCCSRGRRPDGPGSSLDQHFQVLKPLSTVVLLT